jgi:hypothetical protein
MIKIVLALSIQSIKEKREIKRKKRLVSIIMNKTYENESYFIIIYSKQRQNYLKF